MYEKIRLVPANDGKYDVILNVDSEEIGEEFSSWLKKKQISLYAQIASFMETRGKNITVNAVKIVSGGAVLASFLFPKAALSMGGGAGNGLAGNPLSEILPKDKPKQDKE